MLITLIVLIIVGLFVWFWLASAKVHEAAISAAKAMCQHAHWQFLDDTVALKKITLMRNAQGRIQFKRQYQFEYTYQAGERCIKTVTMCGAQPIYKTVSDDNVIHFPKTKR